MLTKLTAIEVTPAALYGKFSNARICDYLKYMFSLISTSLGEFLSEQLDEYTKQVEAHDQAHAEILKESDNVYAKVGDLKKDMLTTEAKFNRKWLRFVQLYRTYLERNLELGLPVENCPTALIYRDYPSLLAKTEAKTLPVSVLCDHILERYDFKKDKRIAKVLCEVEKENQLRKAIPATGKCTQEPNDGNCDVSSGLENVVSLDIDSPLKNDNGDAWIKENNMTGPVATTITASLPDNDGQAVFQTAHSLGQCLPNPMLGLNDNLTQSRKRRAFEAIEMPNMEAKRARHNSHCQVTVKAEPKVPWSGVMHGRVANTPGVLQPPFNDNVTSFGQGRPNGLQLHQLTPNDPKLHQMRSSVPLTQQWGPTVHQSHQFVPNVIQTHNWGGNYMQEANEPHLHHLRPNDPQPPHWKPNVPQPQQWHESDMQEACDLQLHHLKPNGTQPHHLKPNVPQPQQWPESHMQEACDLQLHHLRPNDPHLHHWRPNVPLSQQRPGNHMQETNDLHRNHMMPNGPQLQNWRLSVPQPQHWGDSHTSEPRNVHTTGPWNPRAPCHAQIWSGNHAAARNHAVIDMCQSGWNNAAFQRSGPVGPARGSHVLRRPWQNATQSLRNANTPYSRPEQNVHVARGAFAADQSCYSERMY